MKKILAIAVATAISAPAMADMTIGGTLAFGWSNDNLQGTNVDGSGFGVDTANLSINGSSTTDAGYTVSASMGIDTLSSNNALTGRNAVLAISGDFGTVSFANVAAGSTTRGVATVGAPVNNMEGEILGAEVDISQAKYTLPTMSNVTAYVDMVEAAAMGEGDSSSSIGGGVAYKANGVTVTADYTSWADNSANDNRTRVAAAYDAGTWAVGYGYQLVNVDSGADDKETTVGVRVNLDDTLTVGAAYAKNDTTGTGETAGWTVGASKTLSGNLSLSANYSSWEASVGAATDDTKTNVVLAYSF